MTEPSALDEARRAFQEHGLRRRDLAEDPLVQFQRWYDDVLAAGVHEPQTVVVSTVGEDDQPSSRHVLLKGLDHGFVFFTNYESQKGHELAARPRASLCFPWGVLGRQVRVAGPVERVTPEESDAYFATRPRGSQIGALASDQSEVIADREALEARFAATEARYDGVEVPRPAHWGGYRVLPTTIEFWQGQPSRLHDRFRYTADPAGWRIDRLNP